MVANLIGEHVAEVGLNISAQAGPHGGAVNVVFSTSESSGRSDRQPECGCTGGCGGGGGDDGLPEPENVPGRGGPVPILHNPPVARTVGPADLLTARNYAAANFQRLNRSGPQKTRPVDLALTSNFDATTTSSCGGGGGGGGGGGDDMPECYTVVTDHYWYYPDTGEIEYRYSTYETVCEET